jgi:hypothetical protein
MKQLLSIACAIAVTVSAGLAHAADDAKTAQQNRMATCSADFKATGKDGKERQAFMKECLSAKPETRQSRMTTCSADFKATGKDGKERQAFMKECLSSKPAAKADAPKK